MDGSIKDVKIMRDVVELEEVYAKSTLINKENINYGYISLPKFYVDFSGRKVYPKLSKRNFDKKWNLPFGTRNNYNYERIDNTWL